MKSAGWELTQIAGIATFSEPATFRLKRTPDGTIRVTTNTGISLNRSMAGWTRPPH